VTTATWRDEVTVLRGALEASLTDPRFIGEELVPSLAVGTTARVPRLVGPEDRDEVSAELCTPDGDLFFLTAFGDEEGAAFTYRLLDELWTSEFGGWSRYRVPRPLAHMQEWWVVATALPSSVPLSTLIDAEDVDVPVAVTDAGRWLARLHGADVRMGTPWYPWRSISGVAKLLRPFPPRLSSYRGALRRMLHALAPLASRAATSTCVQTHGRFRDDRVLVAPDSLTVHDFARSAPGDPARDIAEFVFHLRLRTLLRADPAGDALPSLFLDAYLAEAPEEHLLNVPFYMACCILASLTRLLVHSSPMDSRWMDALQFHLDEFHRHVVHPTLMVGPPM
jgi:hypothetical protein